MFRDGAGGTDGAQAGAFMRDLEDAEGIYHRLLDLTRDQSEVLRQGVSPGLLELARAKEQELVRLVEVEGTLGPGRRAWPELRGRLPASLRAEVEGVIGRVEQVLRRLIELEEVEGRRLTEMREATLAEIHRRDGARKAHSAYGPGSVPPALLDQRE